MNTNNKNQISENEKDNLTVEDVFETNTQKNNSVNQESVDGIEENHGKKNNEKKKRKTTKIALFGIIALALTLVGAGGFAVWNSMQRTDLDYFDNVTIDVEGISGAGVLTVTSKNNITFSDGRMSREETKSFFEGVNMTYTLNGSTNDEGIKNGDVIVIELDETEPMLEKYKMRYIETVYTFTVEGLDVLPETWGEVKDKENVYKAVETISTALHDSLIQEYATMVDGQFEVNTSLEQVGVMYKASPLDMCQRQSDLEIFSTSEHCGSAMILYEITFHLPSNYYFTNNSTNKIVYAIPATGILNTEVGTVAKYGEPDSGMYNENEFPSVEDVVQYFEKQGYTFNQ